MNARHHDALAITQSHLVRQIGPSFKHRYAEIPPAIIVIHYHSFTRFLQVFYSQIHRLFKSWNDNFPDLMKTITLSHKC